MHRRETLKGRKSHFIVSCRIREGNQVSCFLLYRSLHSFPCLQAVCHFYSNHSSLLPPAFDVTASGILPPEKKKKKKQNHNRKGREADLSNIFVVIIIIITFESIRVHLFLLFFPQSIFKTKFITVHLPLHTW